MGLKHICTAAGCTLAINVGARWCDKHSAKEEARLAEQERKRKRFSTKTPEAYERSRLYATPSWQRMRLAVLNGEPVCRYCARDGVVTPATVVDHIERHGNDLAKFYDRGNLQPLCKPCHDHKTMTEDYAARVAARDAGLR